MLWQGNGREKSLLLNSLVSCSIGRAPSGETEPPLTGSALIRTFKLGSDTSKVIQ